MQIVLVLFGSALDFPMKTSRFTLDYVEQLGWFPCKEMRLKSSIPSVYWVQWQKTQFLALLICLRQKQQLNRVRYISCMLLFVSAICFTPASAAPYCGAPPSVHPSVCLDRTCVVMQMRPSASTLQHHFLIEPFDLWLIPLISGTILPTECFFFSVVQVCVCVCVCVSPPFANYPPKPVCRLAFKRASKKKHIWGAEQTGALLKVITLHKKKKKAQMLIIQAHTGKWAVSVLCACIVLYRCCTVIASNWAGAVCDSVLIWMLRQSVTERTL